ncbi:caspase-8-like cysteine peptidase [Dinothrombium tinctorium]|uniref:Caspase-8-like cysteine peptidase n=1 Tax=Dinothrombium tinctorium TaxID=1965070 RepID=A0A3S4R2C1_9ACAR|nr:caspase-8-like cysteine peptidase [Dinothrombium tinctorium]RWS10524.1 caspase-8-like cysteine peptidase [Dinothrombium tinctorium]RWS10678.1 caspase-8-like cysteine peptidase [Dinothrombium tinctorium]RWS10712.1 caspase-8-like cysteine peptidase [Dinothrombium tinctorium]
MDLRVLCELLRKVEFDCSDEEDQQRICCENKNIEALHKIFQKCCHDYTTGRLPPDEELKQGLSRVVQFWKSQINCNADIHISRSVLFLYDGNKELASKTQILFDELRAYLESQKVSEEDVFRWSCRMSFDELSAEENHERRHVIEEKLTMFQITRGLMKVGFFGDRYNYVNMLRSTSPFTTKSLRILFERRYKMKTGNDWPKDKIKAAKEFDNLLTNKKWNHKKLDAEMRKLLRSGDLLNLDSHLLSKVIYHADFISQNVSEEEKQKIEEENERIREVTKIRNKFFHEYTYEKTPLEDEVKNELRITIQLWKSLITDEEISMNSEDISTIADLFDDRKEAIRTQILYDKLLNFFKEYRTSSRVSISWTQRLCFDNLFDEQSEAKRELIEEKLMNFRIERESLYYKMNSDPKGYCIIINNVKFKNSPPRCSSLKDAERLKKIFKGFGFKVEVNDDLKAEQMEQCLRNVLDRKEELEKHNALVFIVLTHGGAGHVLGTDEKPVDVIKFWQMFDSNVYPSLCGKPKVLVFQCCRGDEAPYKCVKRKEKSFTREEQFPKQECEKEIASLIISKSSESLATVSTSSLTTDGAGKSDYYITGIYSDIFICYATPFGLTAIRDKEEGSFYIRALCEAIEKYMYEKDFVSILRYVAEHLKKQSQSEYINIPDYNLIGVDKLLYLHSSAITKNCLI